MPDRSNPSGFDRSEGRIRMIYDPNFFDIVPDPLPVGDPCGNNLIIATGLSDPIVRAAKFPFEILAHMSQATGDLVTPYQHYWPFDWIQWNDVKLAYWYLFQTYRIPQ